MSHPTNHKPKLAHPALQLLIDPTLPPLPLPPAIDQEDPFRNELDPNRQYLPMWFGYHDLRGQPVPVEEAAQRFREQGWEEWELVEELLEPIEAKGLLLQALDRMFREMHLD